MSVLVLDQSWQPASVISIREALSLFIRMKAIPVSDEIVAVFRSPSIQVEIPAVIQVSALSVAKAIIRSGVNPEVSRRRIMARDSFECQFVVDGNICTSRATTVDHVYPRSLGGADSWENLVAACGTHNRRKSNKTMDQLPHWKLLCEPTAPKFMVKKLEERKDIHPAWVYFLNGNQV